jgi:heptosyltransferase-2
MATLIYHCGALGDFLTVLPVMQAWRRIHPGEKIILLGKPAYGTIARGSGWVDEIRDAESASNAWLFSRETAIPENARSLYAEITSAVLFAAPDSPITHRLSQAGIQNIFSQPPFPDRRIPAVEYHLSIAPGLSPGIGHVGPAVQADPAVKNDALRLLEGIRTYVVIHPGSGSKIKNWPFEKFALIAEKCRGRGLDVLWIYGEAENGLPEPAGVRVVRNAPLTVLVHLLKMSRGYMGNDSGISHLAAAAGCRCVVLFGPSDDVVWGPRGAQVTIVKARRTCGPCHPLQEGAMRCGDSCMREISVEEVFEAFLRTTSSAGRPNRGSVFRSGSSES